MWCWLITHGAWKVYCTAWLTTTLSQKSLWGHCISVWKFVVTCDPSFPPPRKQGQYSIMGDEGYCATKIKIVDCFTVTFTVSITIVCHSYYCVDVLLPCCSPIHALIHCKQWTIVSTHCLVIVTAIIASTANVIVSNFQNTILNLLYTIVQHSLPLSILTLLLIWQYAAQNKL